MLSSLRFRSVAILALSAALLVCIVSIPAAAQRSTANILGTVTDSSGAAIPNAMVTARNADNGATQNATTDASGRYRLADLPVGTYDVTSENSGFESVVHKGVTLTIGAEAVVDFSLPVGQLTQTVTVEGEVSTVETTSAALSNLVAPTQMRELPLNGRNYEQLILLAPGVQTISNISKGLYYGSGNAYSVSGSRANGQQELMDDTDVNDYMNRGSGAGVLATAMGVDAIAEFQTLTNTYGAQFGGNGAVMNAVSKSGTNAFHGSAYEFLRNSALDARNFYDPAVIPAFRRNQFGGTLGGPVKKNKMFFFVNYEGLRQGLGETHVYTVLDANARNGIINGVNFGIAPSVAPVLAFYSAHVPLPATSNSATDIGSITETGTQTGTENYVLARYDWTISSKDSIFTRYLGDVADLLEPFGGGFNLWPTTNRDHNQFETIEEKHIFSTNIINTAHFGYSRPLETSYTTTSYPQYQFYGPGSGLIDATVSVTGTNGLGGATSVNPIRLMQNKFAYGDDVLWTKGAHTLRFGGSITRTQSGTLQQFPGGGTWTFNSPQLFLQGTSSSFSGPIPGNAVTLTNGQQVVGTYGQRDFRENDYAIYAQDDWKAARTFTINIGLRYMPTSNPNDPKGVLTAVVDTPYGPGAVACTPPSVAAAEAAGIAAYTAAGCSAYGTVISPVGVAPAGTASFPTAFSPVSNVYQKNPSYRNLDPRIGIAWDPFKDHKTSVRAGYGIFHAVTTARDYAAGYYFTPPWATGLEQNPTFPVLNPAGFTGAPSDLFGFNRYIDDTPYIQQWNLSIQREIMKNTVATLAYVGSRGTHLVAPPDENPPLADGTAGAVSLTSGQTLVVPAGVALSGPGLAAGALPAGVGAGYTAYTCGAAHCYPGSATGQPFADPATGQLVYSNIVSTGGVNKIVQNSVLNPNFSVLDVAETIGWSKYNSLQAGIVRQISNGLQAQISYTYSECTDNESGSWALDAGSIFTNPFNYNADAGWCSYQIRSNIIVNAVYLLPFHGSRWKEGWQISPLFNFHSGLPVNVTDGFAQAYINSSSASGTYNRPNYNPTGSVVVNGQTIGCNNTPVFSDPTNNAMTAAEHLSSANTFYINPACFSLPTVGELGNLARNSIIGPSVVSFDAAITKNTRINERMNVQFRAEFFNLPNIVNFSQPGATIFTQQSLANGSATGGGNIGTPGQLAATQTTSRQIQFGLKFMF